MLINIYGILIVISLLIILYIAWKDYENSNLLLWIMEIMAPIIILGFWIKSVMEEMVVFPVVPVVFVVAQAVGTIIYDHVHLHNISLIVAMQQKENTSHGYVAFDFEGRFLCCNGKACVFFPFLSEQKRGNKLPEDNPFTQPFYEWIEQYKTNGEKTRSFNEGDTVCLCEISEFSVRRDKVKQGYLINVRDITKEQKYLDVMQSYNETLNKEVAGKTANIKGMQEKVVIGLANMVENRDNNTGGHIKRTSDVIKYIVDEMEKQEIYHLNNEMATDVVRAAPMHDLGKITIESAILCKPARLTDEEYAIMKTHSVKSGEFVKIILADVEEKHFVNVAYNIARYHHERWDGKGYPEGLVGEMIPLEARIMAIADVYDALVSKRCYKEPMSFEKASEIMCEGMGTQFDPNLYSVFLGCRDKLEQYYSENRG